MRHPYMTYGSLAASEHYLASTMASEVLREGGNAVDAAVVASLSLSVLLPHLGGLGGDFFALVKRGSDVKFIDGSGPSPLELTREELVKRGYKEMPANGPLSITVPGYLDGLYLMWRNYGEMDWRDLVLMVAKIARDGFPVSDSLSSAVKSNKELLSRDPGSTSTYLSIGGRGDRQRFKGMASALEKIAQDPREFYEGDIALKIVNYVRSRGGCFSLEDLSRYRAEEGYPVAADVWDFVAYEMPPPTQGVTTLHMMMLTGELEGPYSWERIKKMVEISRIAYYVRDKYITDPKYMKISLKELLSPSIFDKINYIKKFDLGDTTFFTVVDSNEMAVAGIQSIFTAFGSGLTEPEYQITLNCRASSFSLDEDHVNRLEPGKKTLHTLSSLLLEKDGDWYIIGTSGGHFRPQLHWWISTNLLKYKMDYQEALNFPRAYFDLSSNTLVAEEGLELREDGISIRVQRYPSRLGVAAIAHIRNDGLKTGCVDIRGDGGCSGTLF
ncbi:MAG: gamma-glutamyltransferase family protein [Candidatus Methanodesulfokora sp.]